MTFEYQDKIESETLGDFAKVMAADRLTPLQSSRSQHRTRQGKTGSARVELTEKDGKNGLGQLVLTIVKLLHELLERQAIKRIEGDSLTDEQIEELGMTLMKQGMEIQRLTKEFGLEEDDLNLDLGPLGKLL